MWMSHLARLTGSSRRWPCATLYLEPVRGSGLVFGHCFQDPGQISVLTCDTSLSMSDSVCRGWEDFDQTLACVVSSSFLVFSCCCVFFFFFLFLN